MYIELIASMQIEFSNLNCPILLINGEVASKALNGSAGAAEEPGA